MDDELVLSVDSVLETTLENNNALFIKISRKEFLSIEELFICMRGMVYKSEELELACGESEVRYRSLCYIRAKKKPKQYYVAITTFRIPPSEFFGDKEELKILQWFITHKSKFLREQNRLSKLQGVNLSDAELKEVEVCSEVFAQQEDHDVELSAQINEV